MKQISYKKALVTIGIVVVIFLAGIAGLVIAADPFFHYHKPLPFLNYVIDNQLTQNGGMIKHFDYDSVILGSSMTVNFDTELFEQELGLNTIKLSTNAAYPKDIDKMMSGVVKSDNDVKTVFIGIDVYNYAAAPEITAYPYPEYLYDDNLINDVAYLFNKDVVLDYILKPQIQGTNTKLNEVYNSWRYSVYGKDAIAKTYKEPQITANMMQKDVYIENTEYNLENYILPYIREMEDTEFIIFYPPYSILYWYNHMAEGDVEARLYQTEYITEKLLQYPNVRVFQFQNDFEYITNYDNYADYTHYRREMNNYMTKCFAGGECELTLDNYKQVFAEMSDYLMSFDYENCW